MLLHILFSIISDTTNTMLLEASHVDRFFQIGSQSVQALARISVSVNTAEFLVITGPSGSGKSTLLNLLSGLDRPSNGDVFFKGESFSQMNGQRLTALRNASFGFIFQTPHLLPDKTVLENTLLPFSYGHYMEPSAARTKCLNLLDYIGMEHLADRYPNTLSGGEMQRVVFARALSREPDIIFADEPTGSLDGKSSRLILELLQEQVKIGRTVIMVSHDTEAIEYGSVTLSLNKFLNSAMTEGG